MEPSGRNRWQPVANEKDRKTAQTGRYGNRSQSTATHPELDGKEGVDGSSPSEGFTKSLLISVFWQRWS